MNIPAISYMGYVKQFYEASGRRIWTWRDWRKAIAYYEIFGAIRN
jgi:hypothetical protein